MAYQTKNLQENKELTHGMNEKELTCTEQFTKMKKNIPSSQHLTYFYKNDRALHNKANIGRYEKNVLTMCLNG